MARSRNRNRYRTRPPVAAVTDPFAPKSQSSAQIWAIALAKVKAQRAKANALPAPALDPIANSDSSELEDGPIFKPQPPEEDDGPTDIITSAADEPAALLAAAAFAEENKQFERLEARRIRMFDLEPGQPAFYRNAEGVRVAKIRLTRPALFGENHLKSTADQETARVLDAVRTKLSDPMLLCGPATIDAIDQLAAALHAEAPHMRAFSQSIRESASQFIRHGAAWFQIRPTLLVGPPGTGKSFSARLLARLAGLPFKVLDGASMTSPVPLTGLDGSWRSGRISEVGLKIVESCVPNPFIILDEVDKIGTLGTDKTGTASEALLGLIEPSTARLFPDSYLRQEVDLSRVNWILTANHLERVPEPVLDRCTVVVVGPMSVADMARFAAREIERRDLDPDILPFILGPIRLGQSVSLRKLGRMLDAAEAALERPLLN